MALSGMERAEIMTNQEASKVIKDGLEDMSLDFADEEQYEALTMAIKALSQEPKTGHWIAQDIHNRHTDFKCSECGYIHNFMHLYVMHLYGEPTADYTYCPNCGAKMVEQESEENHE